MAYLCCMNNTLDRLKWVGRNQVEPCQDATNQCPDGNCWQCNIAVSGVLVKTAGDMKLSNSACNFHVFVLPVANRSGLTLTLQFLIPFNTDL